MPERSRFRKPTAANINPLVQTQMRHSSSNSCMRSLTLEMS